MARPIVFLSDYGLHDEFVGLCHAVIARIAPRARVIDLTHGIAPGALRRGAQTLRDAVAYLPDGDRLVIFASKGGSPTNPPNRTAPDARAVGLWNVMVAWALAPAPDVLTVNVAPARAGLTVPPLMVSRLAL